jgi:hypothetical protein
MKITTQQELDDLIATADESNTIVLNEDLQITFDCEIPCNIKVYNIETRNITAGNIQANNIYAWNINAGNIQANNIYAWDINADNINAWNINADNIDANNIKADNIKTYDIYTNNINAWNINADNIKTYDINAHNINAHNINAHNIKYYAFCIAYQSLKCESISGNRENSFHKCLDQAIEIVKKEEKVTIELTQEQLNKIKHLI